MEDFFASLYEWFGVNPFFSNDLGDFLRGFDQTCTGYLETPHYIYIGWSMISITAFMYIMQYHILDRLRLNRFFHWWIFALIIFLLNFSVAFSIPYNAIEAGEYCNQLIISTIDCSGFGISNAIWSLILFVLLTSFKYPKAFSINCKHTTLWKP